MTRHKRELDVIKVACLGCLYAGQGALNCCIRTITAGTGQRQNNEVSSPRQLQHPWHIVSGRTQNTRKRGLTVLSENSWY